MQNPSKHTFITKYDKNLLQKVSGITKCARNLLQSASGITKSNKCYKVWPKLLKSALGITKFDKKLLQCVRYYKVWQLLKSVAVQGILLSSNEKDFHTMSTFFMPSFFISCAKYFTWFWSTTRLNKFFLNLFVLLRLLLFKW